MAFKLLVRLFLVSFFFQPLIAGELSKIKGKDVASLAKKEDRSVTFVNVWATWCPPCVAEFPDLVHFHNKWEKKNVRFEFISADFESEREKVLSFLKNHNVDFKTYLKDEDDEKFIKDVDPKWKGALPTTFLFNSSGKILYRWDKPVTIEELESKIPQASR